MSLRLPPPLVLVFTLGAMYLLSIYWPLVEFHFFGQKAIIFLFLLFGALIGLAAIMSFARVKTTVDPRNPHKTSSLVTKGIYQYTRNPMYLGLLCLLLAAFFYLSALSALFMIIAFVFFINSFQIEPEEAVLEAMFGDDYREYCQQVRRWC
ncbi:methyltransferase family protein [Photobacterium minamisatsumaniensis]|uniref:methyltransferase family protein n=1 Tax=Photobacterium minamisatsumaniensis TaxID=2910233 RepID=UPI003D0BEF2C